MPPDPRALVRVLDELLWTLRREGFDDLDGAGHRRAAGARCRRPRPPRRWVREAIAAVVVEQRAATAPLRRHVRGLLRAPALPSAAAPSGSGWRTGGSRPDELDALRELLEQLARSGHGDGVASFAMLARQGAPSSTALLALAGIATGDRRPQRLQLGFQTHRLLGQLGAGAGAAGARRPSEPCSSTPWAARGDALADALAARARSRRGRRPRPRAAASTRHAWPSRSATARPDARDDAVRALSRTPRSRRCAAPSAASPSACAEERASAPGEPCEGESTPTARCGARCAPAASRSTRPVAAAAGSAPSSCSSAT